MKNEAYWREDKKDDYIHFCFECPEIVSAKKIGKGTIEEANASGHVRACAKCNAAKAQIIKEKEEEQKKISEKQKQEIEKIREKEKHNNISNVVVTIILTVAILLIPVSSYCDKIEKENYNQGYNDGLEGIEDAEVDSYGSGYNDGYKTGYDDGYFEGVTERQGYENTYNDDDSEIVYVTNTGSKYHAYGCQYLSDSCYSIPLYKAIERGYTPCSRCDPPQ